MKHSTMLYFDQQLTNQNKAFNNALYIVAITLYIFYYNVNINNYIIIIKIYKHNLLLYNKKPKNVGCTAYLSHIRQKLTDLQI